GPVGYIFPKVPWSPYLRLAVWIAYFNIAQFLPVALFRVRGQALAFGVSTGVVFLATTSCQVYFVAVRGQGAVGSLYGQLLPALVIAPLAHCVVLRQCTLGVAWQYLAAACRLSLPYLPHVLFLWALNMSDRWILGHFVPASELGLYNVAYSLGMLVQ